MKQIVGMKYIFGVVTLLSFLSCENSPSADRYSFRSSYKIYQGVTLQYISVESIYRGEPKEGIWADNEGWGVKYSQTEIGRPTKYSIDSAFYLFRKETAEDNAASRKIHFDQVNENYYWTPSTGPARKMNVLSNSGLRDGWYRITRLPGLYGGNGCSLLFKIRGKKIEEYTDCRYGPF